MSLPSAGAVPERTQTLADMLARGPLPFAAALRCATEIAAALRDLHAQGRGHGRVEAGSVVIGLPGAQLLPSRSYWEEGLPARDIREFGALLSRMLTGTDSSPAGVRAAALQVAARCAGEGGAQPSLRYVVMELRLLTMMLRIQETRKRTAAPAPFLVAPATPFLPASESAALRPASFGQATSEPPQAQPAGGNCPNCDNPVVFVSRPHSAFENLLDRIKVPICRCHRCYHRYVVFARLKIGKEMPAGEGDERLRHSRTQ
jgi:hypothetical protein